MAPSTSGKQLINNTLASRTKVINIILLLLVFIIIAIITIILLTKATSSASKDLARADSVRAAGAFHSFINKNLLLVQVASNSTAIGDWYADESNQDKKRTAYNELMNYTDALENIYLRLCLSQSMNVYLADAGIRSADFVPYSKITASSPSDGWYIDCFDSESAYTLYIGINHETGERQLIICHKVKTGEEISGVFSTGIDVRPLIENISVLYKDKDATGFIVDKQGVVAGSAEEITNTSNDAGFESIIDAASGIDNGFFSGDEPPQVVKLSQGSYKYAAIAPIAETDWSYVILFNNSFANGFTDNKYIPPLLIVLVFILILYAVMFNIIIHRIVFTPLEKLANSVPKGGVIYGIGRDDEIGLLARTINKMHYSLSSKTSKAHEANENYRLLLDSVPISCFIWNKDNRIIECNKKALELFDNKSKTEVFGEFFNYAPEFQPNGQRSVDMALELLEKAFSGEKVVFTWCHRSPEGNEFPVEVTLIRVKSGNTHVVASYAEKSNG